MSQIESKSILIRNVNNVTEISVLGIALYDPRAIHSDTAYSYVEPRLYSNVLTLVQKPGHTPDQKEAPGIGNPSYSVDSEYHEIGIPREERTKPARQTAKAYPPEQTKLQKQTTKAITPPPTTAGRRLSDSTSKSSNSSAVPRPTDQFQQQLHAAVQKTQLSVAPAAEYKPRYVVTSPEPPPKPKWRNPPPVPQSNPEDFQLPARQPLQRQYRDNNTKMEEENLYTNNLPRSVINPVPINPAPMPNNPVSDKKGNSKYIRKVENSDDVAFLTIDEVGDYLKQLKLEAYVESFKAQMIDGSMLLALDRNILKEEFGMKGIEALRLVKFAQEGHIPM